MDTAKIRIIASVGAAFFGFIGTAALCVAGALALAPIIGLAWAVFTMACLMLALGCICALIFLNPGKSSTEELDHFEHATAQVLADLPFDAIASVVEKRPITAATLAMMAGYFVVTNPEQAAKGLQKLADELI